MAMILLPQAMRMALAQAAAMGQARLGAPLAASITLVVGGESHPNIRLCSITSHLFPMPQGQS